MNAINLNWKRLIQEVLNPRPNPDLEAALATNARHEAPVFWLLGKVQSGKTSIIHAITRHPEAAIGAGFKPCTRHARQFEFPPELPMVRFIDTRGLGEIDYHPEEELIELEQQADALIVVTRALDPQQEMILTQLEHIRRRHPRWPVVLVQTRLHDAYKDDRDHPAYDDLYSDPDLLDLQRALKTQADTFSQLPGTGPVLTVAVDLTKPEDQFTSPDYGLDALLEALDTVLEETQRQQLRTLTRMGGDQHLKQLHPHLVGYATAAGLTDMIPLAGAFAVPSLQGKMLHSIGGYYGRTWDRRSLTEFTASLGSGTLLGMGASFGARQLGKLIPIYGQSLGAVAAGSASAAVTYALGRAACYYLEQAQQGVPDPQGVGQVYRGSLKEAYHLFEDRLRKQKNSESS